MPHLEHSHGRPFATVLSFALALSWAVPTTALAGQPDPTAAPVVEPAAPEPAAAEPVAQPEAVPAPVYEPPPPQPIAPAPAPLPNRNRGLGLMIAGVSVFTFSYLMSVAAGVVLIDSNKENIGRPMLIPIAGPFIAIGQAGSATGGLALGFAGIAQLVGFGMGVGGGVVFARSRSQARLSVAPGGLQLRF